MTRDQASYEASRRCPDPALRSLLTGPRFGAFQQLAEGVRAKALRLLDAKPDGGGAPGSPAVTMLGEARVARWGLDEALCFLLSNGYDSAASSFEEWAISELGLPESTDEE